MIYTLSNTAKTQNLTKNSMKKKHAKYSKFYKNNTSGLFQDKM